MTTRLLIAAFGVASAALPKDNSPITAIFDVFYIPRGW